MSWLRSPDHPDGRDLIDRMIRALVKNPYPTYRDIALTSAGAALLGSSDRAWIRPLLRRVLRAGLDDEGVTFTFDVPTRWLAQVNSAGPNPAIPLAVSRYSKPPAAEEVTTTTRRTDELKASDDPQVRQKMFSNAIWAPQTSHRNERMLRSNPSET